MDRLLILLVLLVPWTLAQDTNIIPNLLRPFMWGTDQYRTINLMANVSEKIFHAKKIGLSFGGCE